MEVNAETVNQDTYMLDSKTEKSLMKTLMTRTLERALEPQPPSPMEMAINNVTSQIGARVAENMLGNLAGGTPIKAGILSEILNSQFGAGLGQGLGGTIPAIIETLTRNLGEKKTNEIIDTATNYMNKQSNPQNEQLSDKILSLDINNPEHVRMYAGSKWGGSKDGVRSPSKGYILNERSKLQRASPPAQPEQSNQDQVMQALLVKIEAMDATIRELQAQKIEKINETVDNHHNKWNDDETTTPAPFNTTTQTVSIFKEPIKVNLDDIDGADLKDSFFKEKPIEPAKEEIKQVIDKDGNSSFEVENKPIIENSKVEEPKPEPVVEETIVEETKPEIKENEPRKRIHRVIKKKDEIKIEEIK